MHMIRLPRLTLFSGPNCSLCVIAKAELAKVRQSHTFQLDVVNIQEKGQEQWKEKYIHWIPALHLDGKEIAKGRWEADVVVSALKRWETMRQLEATQEYGWAPIGTYIRASENILGDTNDFSTSSTGGTKSRHCFNCGSPDHKIDACPLPHDRQRITLSRQLYLFLKDNDSAAHERIHVTSEWNKQRLEWADMFTPGMIKGELLQTALDDEEYLKRIAVWGYPRGWYSIQDPRKLVQERILKNDENSFRDSTPIMIFGDENESDPEPGFNFNNSASVSHSRSRSQSPESEILPKRWARYPCSYFNSDTLFLYTPRSQIVPFDDSCLPPLRDQASTFTPERQRLWERIISGEITLENDIMMSQTPWRRPGAFSPLDESTLLAYAPPPTESPPPIPPSPEPVVPKMHDLADEEKSNSILVRPARPLLKSVSPYGLLFSNPGDDFNTAPYASEDVICTIDSPLSIASDMDLSDTD